MKIRFLKSGFSLVEVLVFVTILGLFFIAALSVTTYSLKNMQISEHKILATHYAEEGLEWVKSQKEADWITFTLLDTSPAGAGTTYCINNLDWSNTCTPLYGLENNMFKRDVKLSKQGEDQVNIEITVSWLEGNVAYPYPVILKTIVKIWE